MDNEEGCIIICFSFNYIERNSLGEGVGPGDFQAVPRPYLRGVHGDAHV